MSVPTEGPLENSLYLLTSGAAEQVHAAYGTLRPTSVDAAIKLVKGTADQAYSTVSTLSASATALPAGSTPTVSVTGPMGAKVINFSIPRGPRGLSDDGAVQVAMSQQAGTAMRVGVNAGTVGLLVIADSKGAGTGLTDYTNRWQNRLLTLMRARFPITSGDTGRGIIPANMTDPYAQMSGRPTWSAGVLSADNVGLGFNTAHIPAGQTVTFPSLTWPSASTLWVGAHTNGVGAAGTLEVLVDGSKVGEINCAGTGEGAPVRVSFPIAAGTHTVAVRGKAGGEPARLMYIEHRTAATGWHLYDSSRPGMEARMVAGGKGGAAFSAASYATSVAQLPSVRLAVIALGANDLAPENAITPAAYGASLRTIAGMVKAGHPTAGIVVLLPAALTGPGASVDVQAYHSAARSALDGVPDLSILAETQLVDLTGPNASAWLADTVHPNAFGHDMISRALAGSLIGLDGPSDALGLVEAAAAPAVAAAQSAQADAADAATRAEHAEAAKLEIPDVNVGALVGNDTTETVAALEARYRPAARSPITGWFHADHFALDRQTITRAVIQAAVDAASQGSSEDGTGGVVYIPEQMNGESWLLDGPIVCKPRVTIKSGGRTRHRHPSDPAAGWTLKGNGVDPVFTSEGAASYDSNGVVVPGTVTNGNIAREITIRDITAYNDGAPVVSWYHSNNFTIDNVFFQMKRAAPNWETGTIRIRYSYRGQITNSQVAASGGGWAVDVRDNANGVLIDGVTASGGSAGGAIFLSASIAARITRNVVEMSQRGIHVAGGVATAEGTGTCHSVVVEGNYVEQCAQPYSIGATHPFRGGRVTNNWASLPTAIGSPYVPAHVIELGRVLNTQVIGNLAIPHATEPFFKYKNTVPGYAVGTGGFRLGEITQNTWTNGSANPMHDTSALDNNHLMHLWGENKVQQVADQSKPEAGPQEFISPVIKANLGTGVGLAAGDIMHVTGINPGGRLQSVEVIDARGTLTGARVYVGSSYLTSELLDVSDLGAVTMTGGRAGLTPKPFWILRSGYALVYRVDKGTGTGEFRLRIRWNGAA